MKPIRLSSKIFTELYFTMYQLRCLMRNREGGTYGRLLLGGGLISAIVFSSLATVSEVEADVTFNVTSEADLGDTDPGNGTCQASNGQCTLRAAIEETNALQGGDTIHVPAGNYLLNDQLVIKDDVKIYGAGKGITA